MTIVLGMPVGLNPMSGWVARMLNAIRYTCYRRSQAAACIANWIKVRLAKQEKYRAKKC